MKTKKFTLVLATILLASAAFVSSCKKKTEDPKDTDTAAASDNSMAESSSNDAIKMAGQASDNGSLSSYRTGPEANVSALSCATVTVNTTTKIITATFGGGVCLDGHYRTGSITFDYSGSTLGATAYRHPGFKCVITTQNYTLDGNAVTLNKTIINTTAAGFNPATTNLTWSVTGSVTIVKINNGGTVTWNCSRTITLMNTGGITYNSVAVAASYTDAITPISWITAVVSVSGNANGTTTKGEAYNFNVTSPLVVNMNCTPDPLKPGHHPIVQGSFDFTPGTKATRKVDFGNGSCDNTFTVSINGVSYTITIK